MVSRGISWVRPVTSLTMDVHNGEFTPPPTATVRVTCGADSSKRSRMCRIPKAIPSYAARNRCARLYRGVSQGDQATGVGIETRRSLAGQIGEHSRSSAPSGTSAASAFSVSKSGPPIRSRSQFVRLPAVAVPAVNMRVSGSSPAVVHSAGCT